MSEVELRKCLYEFHDIDNLSSKKLVSFVEATSIRYYSRETNKLRNIYTIGSGAKNTSIKKWEINYFRIKTIPFIIKDETMPFQRYGQVQVQKGLQYQRNLPYFN